MSEKLLSKSAARRRERILESALSAFLELGYGNTSMDEVVKRAGGSKSSIYKYFRNKENLFATVVDELVRHRLPDALDPEQPPQEALQKFAESRLKVLLNQQHIDLRRLVIAESARFPNIARLYYQHGPELSIRQIEAYLRALDKRGTLKVENAHTAAVFFTGMLMHYPWIKVLLSVSKPVAGKKLTQHAHEVVTTFLAAYRCD